jgi:hypothetical protein
MIWLPGPGSPARIKPAAYGVKPPYARPLALKAFPGRWQTRGHPTVVDRRHVAPVPANHKDENLHRQLADAEEGATDADGRSLLAAISPFPTAVKVWATSNRSRGSSSRRTLMGVP